MEFFNQCYEEEDEDVDNDNNDDNKLKLGLEKKQRKNVKKILVVADFFHMSFMLTRTTIFNYIPESNLRVVFFLLLFLFYLPNIGIKSAKKIAFCLNCCE